MIEPVYSAAENRYECGMQYRRAGRSGVMLPAISLGLWHNFGDVDTLSLSRKKLHYAFDHGITHFDLRLPGITWRKVGMTSNHHAPYDLGYTRATMA